MNKIFHSEAEGDKIWWIYPQKKVNRKLIEGNKMSDGAALKQ